MEETSGKDALRDILKKLKQEYKYKGIDIFEEDEQTIKANLTKYIIEHELTEADKNIIYLYSYTGGLRKLSKLLNCSHTSCSKEVRRIKEIIKGKLNKLYNVI